MPTIMLKGGLGNQLFQYSVGRHLSTISKSQLKIDANTILENNKSGLKSRKVQITNFSISSECSFVKGISSSINKIRCRVAKELKDIGGEIPHYILNVYIDREPLRFDPRVFDVRPTACLSGYFQSEKYFSRIRSIILNELNVVSDLKHDNKMWAKKIRSSRSVSVHVRRGDYKHLDRLLPKNYYSRAIQYVLEKFADIELFFFSDDTTWVKKHIDSIVPCKGKNLTHYVVDTNDISDPHEDMRLMRLCNHNIISNSTFSWWGAWLNRNSEKIVVAPDYWVRNNVSELDIVPKRWKKVTAFQ